MTYLEKLQDPRWQKKRLEIFQRDGWACTECNDTTRTLHIHHLYYTPNCEPWEYPNSALVSVCYLCHSKFEFEKWLYRIAIPKLKSEFTASDSDSIGNLIARKVWTNHHPESVERYMNDIKNLVSL